jgi:hypothetical protein
MELLTEVSNNILRGEPELLPVPPNEEPVILNEEQSEYYRKRDLLQKIKVCVSFDLVSQVNGQLAQYADMTKQDQLRFKKQCSRLFDVCIVNAKEEAYITDRFNEIVSEVMLGAGVEHERLAVHRNPYL